MDGRQHRLALIELLERDGRVRRAIPIERWPATLGRSFDCDVVIDDPHVAAHHATIVQAAPAGEGPGDEGGEPGAPLLLLRVEATRNGVQLGPRTLVEGEVVPLPLLGEAWQLGATRLRVRLPGDPIEPERPLGLAATGARPSVTAMSALGLWALVLAEHGVDLDPGATLGDWLVPLLAFPAALVGWCVLWGIASKLLQHRFEFWAHFSIIVKGLLLIAVLDLLLPLLAYSLSWEWLSRTSPEVSLLIAAATLYRHGMLALPLRPWVLASGMAACLALGVTVMAIINVQRTDRVFPEPYLATLAPPAFRLAPGVSVKEFVSESQALKERVDALAGPAPPAH